MKKEKIEIRLIHGIPTIRIINNKGKTIYLQMELARLIDLIGKIDEFLQYEFGIKKMWILI